MFHTISSKLTWLFSIAFVAIFALFFSTHSILRDRAIAEELVKLSLIAKTIERVENSKTQIDEFLKSANFTRVKEPTHSEHIKQNAALLMSIKTDLGSLNGYFLQGDFYISYIDENNIERLYYSDANIDKFSTALIITCCISIGILAFLYILLIRHLKPIYRLAQSMRQWRSGAKVEFLQANTNDEIGELTREFKRTARRIDSLITSRQFFLRAIMHELKTPIGKGRIIAALPASEQNYQRLDAIFTRLDLLVNEFAQMEKVLSRDYTLQAQSYRCSLIYEQAIDLLMIEDLSVINVDLGNDDEICVDLNLFSLLLKNLLDNALKYCSKHPINVIFKDGRLKVSNYGKPLKGDFKDLSLAFIQGDATMPGLGLGLYLIGRIIRMHGFKFAYDYSNGMHNFEIICQKG